MDNKIEKIDVSALFKIGYGLYVLTTDDGRKDNGCIVNCVMQVTSNPLRVAVAVNKQNYSCETVLKTLKMNINCLSKDAPFEVFRRFGFQSGRNTNKFDNGEPARSENGCAVITEYANAFLSLEALQTIDLGTHIMFVCAVTEAKTTSESETMTYTYYQKHVKPKPAETTKNSYVCRICGYEYSGEKLPEDYICPICKHDATAFERKEK